MFPLPSFANDVQQILFSQKEIHTEIHPCKRFEVFVCDSHLPKVIIQNSGNTIHKNGQINGQQ